MIVVAVAVVVMVVCHDVLDLDFGLDRREEGTYHLCEEGSHHRQRVYRHERGTYHHEGETFRWEGGSPH